MRSSRRRHIASNRSVPIIYRGFHHWGAIAGADFFTTEVWAWHGLATYSAVFVIDLACEVCRDDLSSLLWSKRSG